MVIGMDEDYEWSIVTPQYESVPTRQYYRDGAVISCFAVVKWQDHDLKRKIITEDTPLYELTLPSAEEANILMENLYYGEYTGG
jgi:hypothetical protein